METSRSASERLLLNIEWSVWWYIVQPPSQAALFMFSFLKTIPMDLGSLACEHSLRQPRMGAVGESDPERCLGSAPRPMGGPRPCRSIARQGLRSSLKRLSRLGDSWEAEGFRL